MKPIKFFAIIILAFSLAHAESLKIDRQINRIIVDPGLGGIDKGAAGCKEGVFAKDINLEISKLLSKEIQNRLDVEVLLTRQKDVKLSLEDRINIINESKSDLLISIQTNSHEDTRANGFEIYFLNMIHDKEDIEWIERQRSKKKSFIQIQDILEIFMINAKISESETIARHVQKSIVDHLKDKYPNVKDRGLKQAPLYLLIGSDVTSISIFTGFISNPKECYRLSSEKFQKELSEGIVKGITAFINDKNY